MRRMVFRLLAGIALVGLCVGVVSAETNSKNEGEPFIAGIAPDHRPVGAPVIEVAQVLNKKDALHGIGSPIPPSVNAMIKDQGNWYTPFTRPGMNGPYDIRHYHH
ncbi:MAG: hypothetical protein FWD62_03665 [Betaproteobacteria bacterium]|nr:hypothetical protein [Betaproteobacteria bacterium]